MAIRAVMHIPSESLSHNNKTATTYKTCKNTCLLPALYYKCLAMNVNEKSSFYHFAV